MAKPALTVEHRSDGPPDARAVLILGHCAGQDMDSPFMRKMAEYIATAGLRVVRFNFPYMTRARAEGRKRPPDRQEVLLDAFRAVIESERRHGGLFIGGKSLGGRMASLLADEVGAAGLVCLGYPFHPPGRPDTLRTAYLENLRTPAIICQGIRDPFGSEKEVCKYSLSKNINIHWLEDGDHGFKPRKSSGRTESENLADAAYAVMSFIDGLIAG